MKLNLLYGPGPIHGEGFLNINPFSDKDTDTQKQGGVENLDEFVDDGEAEQIIALDVIDYLEINKVVPVIVGWVKKLKHGGIITIGGVDLYEVSRNFFRYNISLLQANELIHGKSDMPFLVKKTQFTLKGVIDLLQGQLGLKILKKRLDQETLRYCVEAQRR
jgi:hypothetical protein